MNPDCAAVPFTILPLALRLTGTSLFRSALNQSAFNGARWPPVSGSYLSKRAMATALPYLCEILAVTGWDLVIARCSCLAVAADLLAGGRLLLLPLLLALARGLHEVRLRLGQLLELGCQLGC